MPQLSQWRGEASIKGSSESIRMALLTASLIGLQFTWGIEMTYCTPYLLQLGLTKSRISLVWIAGPLSGLIMQPVVGVMADKSTSRFGRRRPFMVIGSIIVSACLLVLGYTKELVQIFISDADAVKSTTIFLAVLSIYGVDFAINAVQASCRSLVVDTLPLPKQQLGSAWASRMLAVGSLVGYGAGAIDLGAWFGPALGDTQFKQLTTVAAIVLCATVGTTSFAVSERILVDDGKVAEDDDGPIKTLKQLFATATHLPDRIQAICWVQFWSWIGWFPFLFYSTTWVGEIYMRYDAPPEARGAEDTLGQIGRVGSLSLIVFSIITFAGSIALPWLVHSPDDEGPGFTPRPPQSIAGVLVEIEKHKPSLLTAWTCTHVLFSAAMILAPFVHSLRSATTIVAFCGVPWALACWAPFTFMGVEINKLSSTGNDANPVFRAPAASVDNLEKVQAVGSPPSAAVRVGSIGSADPHETVSTSSGELSGVYLGILNLFTTLPQFVGTAISWVVFSLLEPGKSPELAKEAKPHELHETDGPNAIAVCLFIGALSSLGAAYATKGLRGTKAGSGS